MLSITHISEIQKRNGKHFLNNLENSGFFIGFIQLDNYESVNKMNITQDLIDFAEQYEIEIIESEVSYYPSLGNYSTVFIKLIKKEKSLLSHPILTMINQKYNDLMFNEQSISLPKESIDKLINRHGRNINTEYQFEQFIITLSKELNKLDLIN